MVPGDYSDYIVQILWILFFIMIFTGVNQRIQMKLWAYDIRNKLSVIQGYLENDKKRVEDVMRKLGFRNTAALINRYLNYFVIEPVSIEPTDIIRRLDNVLTTRERFFKDTLRNEMPGLGRYERSLIESSLEIVSVLNYIYKVIRHYLLLGEKHNNWILLMQLELVMPEVMRLVETYHKSLDSFINGKPIGDSAGPLLASRLISLGKKVRERVIEETLVAETWIDNRRVFIIKAEGPGSNVGKPGKVLSRLVEELNGNVDLVITVDAALKLEGEETGEIAEGAGAAIGDPGPEKIAIERAVTKHDIPLVAVVIKMGLAEALHTMRKEIYESVERAVDYVRRVIRERTGEKAVVIVAGIGNSIGVAP